MPRVSPLVTASRSSEGSSRFAVCDRSTMKPSSKYGTSGGEL